MAAGMVFNPDGMLVVDILVQPPAPRKRQDKYTMEGTIRTPSKILPIGHEGKISITLSKCAENA